VSPFPLHCETENVWDDLADHLARTSQSMAPDRWTTPAQRRVFSAQGKDSEQLPPGVTSSQQPILATAHSRNSPLRIDLTVREGEVMRDPNAIISIAEGIAVGYRFQSHSAFSFAAHPMNAAHRYGLAADALTRRSFNQCARADL
jgi:hypothetical protein